MKGYNTNSSSRGMLKSTNNTRASSSNNFDRKSKDKKPKKI